MIRREHGFTLVELLAALLAGSILLVVLSSAVGSAGKALATDRADTVGSEIADAALFLRARLETSARAEGGYIEDDRLAVVTSPPDALGAIGPVRLELAVEDSTRDKRLVGRFVPVASDQRLPAFAAQPFTILGGMHAISIESIPDPSPASVRPAQQISFLLETQGGNKRTLVINPVLTSDGRCVFDPVSLACR